MHYKLIVEITKQSVKINFSSD